MTDKDKYDLFLAKAKSFIEDYASHDVNCVYHHSEFCDCGYGPRIRAIRALYNELKNPKSVV